MGRRADIVMITYKSAGYLHLSLPRLLETCGEDDRVWLWHNGDDEETLEALRSYRSDPRVERFHHSRENVRLRPPTSWLWSESTARFVSKVDDDCLVAPGWLDTFAAAHDANPDFGVIGSWRHPDEDFSLERAQWKIQTFRGDHQLMRNLWVQGSGYLMPRSYVDRLGLLGETESFTGYCLRVARAGGVNGFYFPFIREDHMDDPRSPHTLIRTDADLVARLPLSAQANGVRTVADWLAQLEQSAYVLQTASLNPNAYRGWRRRAKAVRNRVQRLVGRPATW
ncbi:glycosyltransferase family 2 protein [Jiangella asiatica]|uniref:Glycosyltransferase family 2 protein n=1 Tax=Jiangella asiatica TaxID=2530372 RepID=A0A4R5D4T3_9ACTN|nr:glycosyltransferase family A protein [Jiangella asiatica]TDE07497.1 glycosyltransferase family 2 protein [Jiangella asiatica]